LPSLSTLTFESGSPVSDFGDSAFEGCSHFNPFVLWIQTIQPPWFHDCRRLIPLWALTFRPISVGSAGEIEFDMPGQNARVALAPIVCGRSSGQSHSKRRAHYPMLEQYAPIPMAAITAVDLYLGLSSCDNDIVIARDSCAECGLSAIAFEIPNLVFDVSGDFVVEPVRNRLVRRFWHWQVITVADDIDSLRRFCFRRRSMIPPTRYRTFRCISVA
jgi:hypothetical protein